ncbi:MAG: hypothetical protein ACRDGM_09945, partial [bacterium]
FVLFAAWLLFLGRVALYGFVLNTVWAWHFAASFGHLSMIRAVALSSVVVMIANPPRQEDGFFSAVLHTLCMAGFVLLIGWLLLWL